MEHMVLLVDDDPNILSSLKRSLRREKYEIHCVPSAEEALKILSKEPIDVVVSDQEMPGMNGTELLARVHQQFPDTVRFILTGKATLDIAIDAINKGAISRFFIKPCNTLDLAVTIRQALQQKELLMQARRLLCKVRRQSEILHKLEEKEPGITRIERDEQGAIVLDDIPADFEQFMKKTYESLEENPQD